MTECFFNVLVVPNVKSIFISICFVFYFASANLSRFFSLCFIIIIIAEAVSPFLRRWTLMGYLSFIDIFL